MDLKGWGVPLLGVRPYWGIYGINGNASVLMPLLRHALHVSIFPQ